MTFKPCVTNCDKDIVFHRNSIFKINFFTMAKEKIINIRVEAELKKQAKKLADQDGRSLSNWILKLNMTFYVQKWDASQELM